MTNPNLNFDLINSAFYESYACCQSLYIVDFYGYMENILIKNHSFDDEFLSLNLNKITSAPSDHEQVERLLDMIKENKHNYDIQKQLSLIKALVCWQSQFEHSLPLIQLIEKFALERVAQAANSLSPNLPIKLGDYSTRSMQSGTLPFAIHSHSIELVSYVIHSLNANLNKHYKNNWNVIHFCIIESDANLMKHLLSNYSIDGIEGDSVIVELIELALQKSNILCLYVLLEHYLLNSNKPSIRKILSGRLMRILKCVSYQFSTHNISEENKLGLFKLLFLNYQTKMSAEYGDESVFSICCERIASQNTFEFLYSTLIAHKGEANLQNTLINATIRKIENSFELNFFIINLLLRKVKRKHVLFEKLRNFREAKLLKPSDYSLKSFKQLKHYKTNSFFRKYSTLIEYDIIPVENRLDCVNEYLKSWANMRHSLTFELDDSFFFSAFLNWDELTQLIVGYIESLLENGLFSYANYMNWLSTFSKQLSSLRLQDFRKLDLERQLNCIPIKFKNPLCLKLLARNQVRYCLNSMSDKNLESLNLPLNLLDYLFNR
jgi:hypothetical protein